MKKPTGFKVDKICLGYSNIYPSGNSIVGTLPPMVANFLGGIGNKDTLVYYKDNKDRIYLKKIEIGDKNDSNNMPISDG